MSKIAIIGIGNPYRGDDGAGWAVIDALEKKAPTKLKLIKLRGEISELLEAFEKYSTLYIVDASSSNSAPGSWQRIDALFEPVLLDNPQTSTHGLSISQAIALAQALEQLPSKLIIYAISGDHYNVSTTLSGPVAEAIEKVAQNILNEEDILNA